MRTITVLVTFLLFICHVVTAQTNCDSLKKENEYLRKAMQVSTPTKTLTTGKIDFNLLKCEGNSKDQTVSVILLLENHDANRNISFSSAKAIDLEGNEYNNERITIGSKSTGNDLYTDVPIKTVIVLSKVLPSVKIFKIVPLRFYDSGGSFQVELKDLTISWK